MGQQISGMNGLHVPIVTPMTGEGGIDENGLRSLAKHMAASEGVTGIVTTARIGEGLVLDAGEQVEVTRIVREVVGDSKVVTSTLDPRTVREALARITAVAAAGADAVMLFPPLSLAWGQVPARVRTEFWRELDAGSALPLVLFQIPVRSYWYTVEEIVEIGRLPRVVAMKEASFSMDLYRETVTALDAEAVQMDVLNGNDRFVAEGSLLGCQGSLIGIANLFPELWARIHDLATSGDVGSALQLQREMRPLQELVFDEPILDAVARLKLALVEDGVLDSPFVRRPQLGLDAAAADDFRRRYAGVRSQLSELI
ncbi:MAG TPA: dihydrodipicolinate synthase family protein [Acidimicrobiales bacterium]|nr:dihydrodipicolinate synthase family protein [Acidimicrobiales bacterium]